jgi:hypothetical protein
VTARAIVAAVVALVVAATACSSDAPGFDRNMTRFERRATALGLPVPPRDTLRERLLNRNPCSYNVNLSEQLHSDPAYFSNRRAGVSEADAFRLTALEVAVFCGGRYRELRAFARKSGFPLPSRRCLLHACNEAAPALGADATGGV